MTRKKGQAQIVRTKGVRDGENSDDTRKGLLTGNLRHVDEVRRLRGKKTQNKTEWERMNTRFEPDTHREREKVT